MFNTFIVLGVKYKREMELIRFFSLGTQEKNYLTACVIDNKKSILWCEVDDDLSLYASELFVDKSERICPYNFLCDFFRRSK